MDSESPSDGHETVGSERTVEEFDPGLICHHEDGDVHTKDPINDLQKGVSDLSAVDIDGDPDLICHHKDGDVHPKDSINELQKGVSALSAVDSDGDPGLICHRKDGDAHTKDSINELQKGVSALSAVDSDGDPGLICHRKDGDAHTKDSINELQKGVSALSAVDSDGDPDLICHRKDGDVHPKDSINELQKGVSALSAVDSDGDPGLIRHCKDGDGINGDLHPKESSYQLKNGESALSSVDCNGDPGLICHCKDGDGGDGDLHQKGCTCQLQNRVSALSIVDCDGIPEENITNGVNSHNGNVEKVSLVSSFTPLDDNYLKAAAKKRDDGILFIDTVGNNGPVVVDSSSSDCVVIDKPEECNGTGAYLNDQEYRDQSDCSSVSDLSVIDYDSDIEIEIEEIFRKGPHRNNRSETANPGELLLKDLPPIQDLRISVPEEECQKVGFVSGIVNELVVIQAMPNTPALDLGTVLFMNNGKKALGEIFDVFGRVKEPYYTVRFNSEKHARSKGVKEGVEIYCAPKTEYTSYVFLHEMIKMKGSDASWENNHEPPAHCLDYSDDEEERASRRKKQAQQKRREGNRATSQNDDDSDDVQLIVHNSHSNPANRPSGTQVAGNQRRKAAEVNSRNSVRNGSCGPAQSTGVTHWRQALPNHVQPAVPPNSSNRPSDEINSHSAPLLHPPGHPPLQNENTSNWGGCNSLLKAARRVNIHLFRHLPCYQQVLDGTYPIPVPRSPSHCQNRMRTVPQWLLHSRKSPLLQNPEPQPHHRPPLLPPPIPNPMVIGPRPRLPSHAPVSPGPFTVPPPSPIRGPLPPMMPGALRPPGAHLNQPIPRPIPNMTATSSLCPPPVNGPSIGSRLSSAHGFPPPYQISSNFGSSRDSMNSFRPRLPPPRPPAMPNLIRPFTLRPSYLFPNSPTTLPRQ